MGSKFVRSILRFKEKKPFEENSFKLYSVLQFCAARDLSEVQMSLLFSSEVQSVLSTFPKNLHFIFQSTREPFLFIACCFEWQRKLKKTKNEYLSNFPIYLDCSANGPQLISLFFALKEFGQFLNLVPQKKEDVRGDFYSTLILKFLVQQREEKWVFLKADLDEKQLSSFCSLTLRPLLKSNIMTRFYGISYNKFYKNIKDSFFNKKKELSVVFVFTDTTFQDFVTRIALKFWKFTNDVPLFQLETLLHMFQKLSHINNRSINWSVFDINIINMYYKKMQKTRYNSRIDTSRTQFVLYKPIENTVSSKQRSAFMANFVHSLDAYVLYRTCAELDFCIIPIHDSFGVHGCNVKLLRLKIQELFAFLVDDQAASKFFINQLAEIIASCTDNSVKEEFLRFVTTNLNFGNLSKADVMSSYYYIYYS
jgi:DNA-directed RNA polymerase